MVSTELSAVDAEAEHVTQRALLFNLRATTYAVSVDFVSRVIEIDGFAPVPGAAPWVVGAVVHEFLPYVLIDPSTLLQPHLSTQETTETASNLQRAILIKSAHGRVLLGVEQLVTIAELSSYARVDVNRPEFPVACVEYVCRAEQNLIGVISVPKLLGAATSAMVPDSMGRTH